jgi:hypothetical protein
MKLNPGDLVMPNDIFLRHIHPYPINPTPAVLVERVSKPGPHLPGANRSWRVLWCNESHLMFENELEVINAQG